MAQKSAARPVTPFPLSIFSPFPCSQEKKILTAGYQKPALIQWEPCLSIYCTGLLYGLLYLKNKQLDISITFCFSEAISGWLSWLSWSWRSYCCAKQQGCYSYHSWRRGWYDCLSWEDHCRVSRYFVEWIGRGLQKKTGREIKENWTCLKNQKCWSLLIRSKNCFQRLVVRVVVPFLWSKQCQVMY